MATDKIFELYLSQPYLTPGAVETVEIARQHIAFTSGTRLLEIAFGKGTTAFTLADEYGCQVVGVDNHGFVAAIQSDARRRGLADRVALLRGDGGLLPLRDGMFDAAICIGAPSIVGTARCMAAMHRALRPGGVIVVSDWTWRTDAVPPEAIPTTFTEARTTLDEYAAVIKTAGFEIVLAEHLPQRVWDAYYAPLRAAIAAQRAAAPDAPRKPDRRRSPRLRSRRPRTLGLHRLRRPQRELALLVVHPDRITAAPRLCVQAPCANQSFTWHRRSPLPSRALGCEFSNQAQSECQVVTRAPCDPVDHHRC